MKRNWLIAAAAACSILTSCDHPEPLVPEGSARYGTSSDATPFYYHQGSPVYLDVDPERLTLHSALATPTEAARAVLAPLGVGVAETTALPQASGHWVLRLSGVAGPSAAVEAAKLLRADSRFKFAANAYRTQKSGSDVLLINRLVVRFKQGVSRRQIDSLNAAVGTTILREPRPDSGFFAYWLNYPADSVTTPLQVAALYDRHPLVEWADPDKISDRRRWGVPTDPYYGYQFYLKNSRTRNGIPVDINVEPAWDITKGAGIPSAGGITVAVIDDGVESSHGDLGGKVEFGYDLFGNNYSGCTDCAGQPYGNDSHGTHVAGEILGQHDNGQGIAGIAPDVYVQPVRIFRDGAVATDAQIADGINWAWYLAGADVLSNSWGGGAASNAITTAINDATTKGRGGNGSAVVFSAGNTSNRDAGIIGPVEYPATLSSVIAVGAINRDGNLTNYTPEGSELDIVAPSGHYTDTCVGEVVTTDLLGADGCNDGPSSNIDYTSTFSGTSAAAPQVAGAAALLFAHNGSLTYSQARSRLLSFADSWGASSQFGSGKLNTYRALTGLTVYINGPTFIDVEGTYTWEAMPSGGDGSYTYQWYVYWDNSGSWQTLGTSKTQSLYITGADGSFDMKVVVSSAGQSASDQISVYNAISCGEEIIC